MMTKFPQAVRVRQVAEAPRSSGSSLNLSCSSLRSPILEWPKDQVVARPWPLGRDWLTRRQVTRSRVVRTQVTDTQVVTRSKIVAYYDEGKDKEL